MARYLLLLIFIALCSCGGDTSSSLPQGVGGGGGGGGTGAPASITLAANPSSLTVLGTSSITATVLDSTDANVPDGTVVTFTLNDSTLGTVTPRATTYNGTVTATFTASNKPGTAIIMGTSGSATDTVNITIAAAVTGSIEFVSATPQVIGVQGSGQTETSTIKFLIKDINGNPVVDGTPVSFTMRGPSGGRLPANGGEYIGEIDSTPTQASASTVNGYANVILHSGRVAGPVLTTATVTGTTMSSSSTPISIGGGVPSASHFTVSTSTYNLPGLAIANRQANISVFLADRFGNYNVLTGTSVSFYSEAGAIDRSDITDSNGSTSVVYRTQAPDPADVAALGGGTCAGGPALWYLYPPDWESCLLQYVNTTYGVSTTRHPRDGWATILASVRGEEAFSDANGNGIYDVGESFTDANGNGIYDVGESFSDANGNGIYDVAESFTNTPQEAFIDKNDNGSWDGGSTDPFEEYIDDNGNSNYDYDGANGIREWDSDKTIFEDIRLLITGGPAYIKLSPSAFNILNGGSQGFTLLVSDINLNPLSPGSKVTISVDEGKLSGVTSYTFPNLFIRGPVELSFVVSDSSVTDTDLPKPATITVKVTWEETEYTRTFSGTID